jgi:hypothetical protein
VAEPRVSPPRISSHATRAARPPVEAAGAVDAYRQSGFVLPEEIDTVVVGLNLEGAVAEASSASKYRSQPMAAALMQWSRGWLARLESLHALEWGNYGAAIGLVRIACDFQAAEQLLLETGAEEWNEWLAEPGISLAPDEHGTGFRLHAFRAAEVLARHETLGEVYRHSADLSMPHFGSTLLLAGADSDPARVLPTFGDRDFHLGLAQLALGWLLSLGMARLTDLLHRDGPFHVPDPSPLEKWVARAGGLSGSADRCRMRTIEEGAYRYAVDNWRRTPGAAAKRVLL